MKINENSEGTGRIAGSDQQILGFRKFRKIYYFARKKLSRFIKKNQRFAEI